MEEGPALALPRVITCSSGGRPSVPSLCWGMLLLKRYFTRTTHAHSPISLNDHMLESPLHFDAFPRFSFSERWHKGPKPMASLYSVLQRIAVSPAWPKVIAMSWDRQHLGKFVPPSQPQQAKGRKTTLELRGVIPFSFCCSMAGEVSSWQRG